MVEQNKKKIKIKSLKIMNVTLYIHLRMLPCTSIEH